MIVKRKHTGRFAVIPNVLANDEQLTPNALAILVYLLAKPSDWQVNIEGLRKRFGIGRNSVYQALSLLAAAGYVHKRQTRGEANQFNQVEYVVFDTPEAEPDFAEGVDGETEFKIRSDRENSIKCLLPSMGEAADMRSEREPLPENPEAGLAGVSEGAASLFSASPQKGRVYKKESTKPLSEEHSASDEAGADAPSVNAKVWKEGKELLQAVPSKPNPSIIGRWLKRTPSDEGKEKLLAIIGAAHRAGTADPVGYVTAALNREFPPPPDPKAFTEDAWRRNVQAAAKLKTWTPAWGPAPGKKGCLVPGHLKTPELLKALSERRIAA